MASVREGTSKDATHALAFRVMRLTRPALKVEMPLKCDPIDIWHGEDEYPAPTLPKGGDQLFAARCELSEPLDACGVSGMMLVPQAFGSIYLGETLCSYISVGNHSKHDVSHVIIKAELQTERQRVVLADNSKSAIEVLPAGGRHDFIIEHDIKELGSHTLVCSAVYYNQSEQKYLPQYFTFVASNPLSVRTKVRTVKDVTFLEACIENSTKSALFLEHCRLDANPSWTVSTLHPPAEDPNPTPVDDTLLGLFHPPSVIAPNGGTRHFLYHLTKASPSPSAGPSPGPSPSQPSGPIQGGNTLGKLEMMWRTGLGEAGRLQTQQILGNPTARKEVELRVLELPSTVVVERPFLTLVALASGVQKVSGISAQDLRDGKPYDTLPSTEVWGRGSCSGMGRFLRVGCGWGVAGNRYLWSLDSCGSVLKGRQPPKGSQRMRSSPFYTL